MAIFKYMPHGCKGNGNMNSRPKWIMAFIAWMAIICLCGYISQASEMLETDDFGVVMSKATKLGRQHGIHKVLLVFDIDNTLLATDQPLGSSQWFDWQAELLKDKSKSPMQVANDLQGLLRIQSLLFTLSCMHPPQKDLPHIVHRLQTQEFPMLLLTARGPNNRDATVRQLTECGYDFAHSAPEVADHFRGVRLPYAADNGSVMELSTEETRRFKLGAPRPVAYDQGIFMTAGQNKGAMLLLFLAHCPRHFAAVIFVDDKEKHTKDVFSALVQRKIHVTTFRYSAEDDAVTAFSAKEKQAANKDWQDIQAMLNRIFKRKLVEAVPQLL